MNRWNNDSTLNLGKKYQNIYEMIMAVYGNNKLKKTAVFKWNKSFSEGREDCKDDLTLDFLG